VDFLEIEQPPCPHFGLNNGLHFLHVMHKWSKEAQGHTHTLLVNKVMEKNKIKK